MKKIFALCCLLLLPGRIAAADADGPVQLSTWTVAKTWKFSVAAADFVQSSNFEAEERKVFMLDSDGRMHVYSAAGSHLGTIQTENQIAAFDVDPRGTKLHLVDTKGNAMTVSIALDEIGSLTWKAQSKWKADSVPADLSVAADGRFFALESDGAVHVYSAAGARLGVVPVDPGTAAVDFISSAGKLCLMNRDGTYKALAISF